MAIADSNVLDHSARRHPNRWRAGCMTTGHQPDATCKHLQLCSTNKSSCRSAGLQVLTEQIYKRDD
jgi:hypothetical protein